ncbi:hypothetical protein BDP27DRAFT_1452335 [Rhodocollybia butyracea]|uniref:Uncharacterized protein n=1 Tax=Rhodocollybia butyracea TaxID=206335 RepID=A0A9P5U180_9AGAR|nr:hypothetical protein BDP27DRAFT_1452335 [Rhodocollybia butyracea]
MTPTEKQLVSVFTEQVFYNIFNLILTLTCYGAFMLGFIIALQSLTMGSWGRPQTVLLACLITTFICFSWIVFDVGAVFLEVDYYALDQTLVTAANKKVMIWEDTSGWPFIINLLLSDSIVVWRAFMLYAQSKFWRFILVILLIANVGLNVGDIIWDTVNEGTEFSKSVILDWLAVVLSLIVNMIATMLFSYKAWNHHQYMEGVNGALVRRGTRAQKILNLLIESGVIFCTVQFIYVIVIVLDACNIIISSSQWSRHTVDAIFITASACYPVAVIGLLNMDNKRLASTDSESSECSKICTE